MVVGLFAGKNLLLVPVVKLLFNHIWDVLRDVPSFQSEYGVILRHLLQVQHYQLHIRKRVYSGEYAFITVVEILYLLRFTVIFSEVPFFF